MNTGITSSLKLIGPPEAGAGGDANDIVVDTRTTNNITALLIRHRVTVSVPRFVPLAPCEASAIAITVAPPLSWAAERPPRWARRQPEPVVAARRSAEPHRRRCCAQLARRL